VLVKAATLSSTPPGADLTGSGYDGVVDVAGNSLDGNNDGSAQGSNTDTVAGDDSHSWSFGTSDRPNLEPPTIRSTQPPAGDRAGSSNIPINQSPKASFDTVLQASTIVTDNALIKNNEAPELADTWWWSPTQEFLAADGSLASGTTPIVFGRVSIDHRLYIPATSTTSGSLVPEYDPFLYSGIQNVYQNCFNPASSNVCRGVPNCCENRPSATDCPYPPAPPRP
jgi:hypothetical protein